MRMALLIIGALVASHACLYLYVRASDYKAYTVEKKALLKDTADLKAAYEARISKMAKDQKDALDYQAKQSATLLADMKTKLAQVTAQKQKTQTLVDKVEEYVTKSADAHCVIPVGFVWGFNASLGPESSVPGDRPANVDSPSGIELSEVAATTESNNGECVARGQVIELWQKWYARSKDIFEKAKALPATPAPQ